MTVVRDIAEAPASPRPVAVAALVWLGACACAAALAADLPDPTRPPTAYRAAASSAATPTRASTPVLQSVLTGEGRKPSAIIDGRRVELGGAVDDMRLTRLDETAAVLTGPRGTTTLALTPGADKHPMATAMPARALAAAAPARKPVPTPVSVRVAEHP